MRGSPDQTKTKSCLQRITKSVDAVKRKWSVTANVKKCAVVVVAVCNEDKVNPVTFECKWGEDELPIADQHTYRGVDISKECSWDAHIAKVIGKGKAQVGKMNAILTDSHLDARTKRCIMINVIVPKPDYVSKNGRYFTRGSWLLWITIGYQNE